MLKQILKFFGFTLVSTQEYNSIFLRAEQLEKTATEINSLQSKISEIQNNLFDFNSFKPELSYNEFCLKNNLEVKPFTTKYHNQYWKDQYVAAHIAFELRKLSLHPELLKSFLEEFAKYDWEGRATFMKKHNWCYNDNEETPTVQDLQYAVISLIPQNDFTHPKNTCSSGGFEVTVNYIDGKPNCQIFFKESDVVHSY